MIPTLLAVQLLALAGFLSLPAGRIPQESAPSPKPEVIFFDDFSGSTLDRSKWNVIVTGRTVNNEQQAYVDSDDTIALVHDAQAEGAANGALVLRPRYRPGFTTPQGRKFDFISGRIDTRGKAEFTYGTVAARIKLTAGAGLWPAFWALGTGRWPDTGEMDIMENVGAPDWVSAALHGPGYFGNTPLVKRTTLPAGKDITAWHVYSVDWKPQELVFKIDDDVAYRVTRPMVEHYGPWAYDNPKFILLNFALGGVYPASVNKVETPYKGLPDTTVQLIKDDKARMLVDWVRVTRSQDPPQAAAQAAAPAVTVHVDAAEDRHAISPLIYGASYANPEQAKLLNLPVNRSGGNATTRYNWKLNATSSGSDWFFLSHPEGDATPGGSVDAWIKGNRSVGAKCLVTVPLIGWAAKLGPNREQLWSFSVAKYGPQQKTEQYNHDMGNGLKPDGKPITGNDPNDANLPVDVDFERGWVEHLVKTFGTAARGGVNYYLLDNEPALWCETHRDVFPVGMKMDDLFARERKAAEMVKSVDPTALVAGPEEWGWVGYLYSGYDSQWAGKNGWDKPKPDRTAHNNMDIAPWLLKQFAQAERQTGKRLLDVFTLHFYPQEQGVGGNDASEATDLLRNRSTRTLWDPNYKDESWINDKVRLIPRMKEWVKTYYPGTKIGVTEYNWGAEENINGAVAQADVLGIFGREGVDLATRWTCPAADTPTFKAMQMYRNYDGENGTFGSTSVRCEAPDPDTLSAFASQDGKAGAVKVMLINKRLHEAAPVTVALDHVGARQTAALYQLTSTNRIVHLPDVPVQGASVSLTLPAQSVTLLVLEPGRRAAR